MKTLLKEIWARISKWLFGWLRGGPHFIVGDKENPYLYRWYIIPRNPVCNIYLHKFLRDDDDRACHDHPWDSISFLLKGKYIEQTLDGNKKLYTNGSLVRRKATFAHRIELPEGKPCWTLFITGPLLREWGFHCPLGWKHWKEFTKKDNPGEVGKGCGEG